VKSLAPGIRQYEEAISHGGLRFTPQRRRVFDVLLEERDHPTATEVYLRAKTGMPSISLATVYNCLETLVECGLVRQVHIDREPTRYCPNLHEHGHFICTDCGAVTDVELRTPAAANGGRAWWKLPPGYTVTSVEVTLRGQCANCASTAQSEHS
jgi:Fur family peroxide stress response transcriptional regulator